MSRDNNEEKLESVKTDAETAKEKNQLADEEIADEDSNALRQKPKSAAADPYIRTVLVIAAIVVIGALLTMISAYLTGVIDFNQTRATNINEFTEARSTAYADSERTAGALSQLAIAQITNGRFLEAEQTIAEARALNSPDEERNQGPLFASAILAEAQGNNELAIERFEATMAQLREDFERVYNSDMEPNWAQAFGLHPNYYDSAIALFFLYRDAEEDTVKQLEMLNIAIEGAPTNADLFVWRGEVRLAEGDNEGAIEDFNEALRFIPDDADALRGLEEAGGQ